MNVLINLEKYFIIFNLTTHLKIIFMHRFIINTYKHKYIILKNLILILKKIIFILLLLS